MEQKELGASSPSEEESKEDDEWEEDIFDDEGEIIKLDVGESICGLLIDRYPSKKYGVQIYKIKVKEDDVPKVLLGTTLLDKLMVTKEIGTPVKIERLKDKPSEKGHPIQVWRTFHKKEANEK